MTAAELRADLLEHFHVIANYWAWQTGPNPDGTPITLQDRCDGVVFSILSALDGCAVAMPMEFDLLANDGTIIEGPFHEFYYDREDDK